MTKPARSVEVVEKIKERMLQESLTIITDEGYGNLTMRNLAARMEMSPTNLYNYFVNKEDIYLALVMKGFESLYNELDTTYKKHADPVDALREAMKAYLNFGISYNNYYAIMFSLPLPKYKDFVGTPFEKKAADQRDASSKVRDFTMGALSNLLKHKYKNDPGEEEIAVGFLQLWTMLHGMVGLYNSKIVKYALPHSKERYYKIIDSVIDKI